MKQNNAISFVNCAGRDFFGGVRYAAEFAWHYGYKPLRLLTSQPNCLMVVQFKWGQLTVELDESVPRDEGRFECARNQPDVRLIHLDAFDHEAYAAKWAAKDFLDG